jgi:hypothetical protein
MINTDHLRLLLIASVLTFGSACTEKPPSPVADQALRIGVGLSGTARASGMSALTELLYAEPLLARESALVSLNRGNGQRTGPL